MTLCNVVRLAPCTNSQAAPLAKHGLRSSELTSSRGEHFLCALHCISGYNSQLIHTQFEVTFLKRHTSTLAHDHSLVGRLTRRAWRHATLGLSSLTPYPLGIVQGQFCPS